MSSLGSAYVEVKPDLDRFGAHLSSGIARSTRGIGSRMASVGKIVGTGIAVGAAAAVSGAGVLIKQSIDNAANLGESLNKTKVVFDDTASSVIKFSKDTANSLGISQAAALEAAGGYGAMFQALGLARKPAADMSISLVKLAADMGSLHNVDPTEMLDKIRAGMSGEMEPLKQFGIVLSETAVKEYAYAEGIAKRGAELEESEKVQARYSLLMKQSASAHDDFGNTMNSLPNLQRRFSAGWTDLTAKLGKEFLPIATKVMEALVDHLPDAFKVLKTVFSFVGNAISGVTKLIGPAIRGIQNLFGGLSDSSGGAKSALGGVVDFVRKVWPDIKNIIGNVVQVIRVLWRDWGDEIMAVVKRVWSFVGQTIQNALRVIKGIIQVFTGLLTGNWKKAWNGIKNITGGIWEEIKDLVSNAFGVLRELFSGAISTLKRLTAAIWTNVLGAVKRGISSVIGAIFSGFRSLLAWFIDWGKKFLDTAVTAFGWIPGIGPKVKAARAAFGRFTNEILGDLDRQSAKFRSWGETSRSNILGTAAAINKARDASRDLQREVKTLMAIPDLNFTANVAAANMGDGLGMIAKGPAGTPTSMFQNINAAVPGAFTISSGYRPGAITASGNPSLHGIPPPWNAVDVVGPNMIAFAQAATASYGAQLRELIHSPLGYCTPYDTTILTKRGWLRHDEVEAGDETVGYNPTTGCSEWTTVQEVLHFASQPLDEVRSKGFRFRCTPGHRWATERRTDHGDERIQVSGMTATHQLTSEHRIIATAPLDDAQKSPLTPHEAAIVGWLLTDGHVVRQWPQKRVVNACIYQSTKKTAQIKRLRELLSDVPHGEHVRRRDATLIDFVLSNPWAERLLDRTGEDLEQLVLNLSIESRQAMFEAMFDAEGTTTKTGQRIWSQNEGPVLEAFILLAQLLGERPSRYHTKPAHPSRRPHQCVTLCKSRRVGGVGTGLHQTPAGHEPVWCVVTELGTWTAQQSGVVTLTGNSIIDGRRVSPVAVADHYDHVHMADRGGVFKGPGMVGIGDIRETVFQPARRVGEIPRSSLKGLRIEGTLNTPLGPAEIRGIVVDEINDDRNYNASRARAYR